jgi:D-alanyl-lipoteichoic acid acyltransferase DltB (MBOAT superfamily)
MDLSEIKDLLIRGDPAFWSQLRLLTPEIGIWHGTGWNYAAFGVAHGLGVAANHYYTVALKKRLGKERFAAYNRNRLIHALAVVLTFIFVTACLFLFANTSEQMREILSTLRSY